MSRFRPGDQSSAPAAAERAIELHDRDQLLPLQRRQIELPPEQVALGIEHLQVTVEAALIAVGRQPRRCRAAPHQLLLLRALLDGPPVSGRAHRRLRAARDRSCADS